MRHLPVLVALASLSLAGHALGAPSLEERFGPRRYVSAGHEVPVTARDDLLVVKVRGLEPSAVASLVEESALKLSSEIRVQGARLLREDGLVVVELAPAFHAPRRALVALAREVAGRSGVVQVYPALARVTGRAFADDRLVVTAAPGRLDDVLARVLRKVDGDVERTSYLPDTALVRVGAALSFDAVEASRALRDVDGLISAEPNLYRELQPLAVVPNDPLFADQWHLSRQNDDVPGSGQIHADEAWTATRGDPSVIVAVFDTGIDVDHPDLAPNLIAGFDAAGNDDDPRPGCSASFDGREEDPTCPGAQPYRESHGTSVSGTIGAVADNDLGVSGVCPQCTLLPVRLIADLAQDSLSIAEAFERAVDLGADVVNNSWGPGFSLFFPLSTAERDAFAYAREVGRDGKGTVIVFAAGNETSDVASDAYASNPYVISVAASTNLDDWAVYSNFGRQVDIAAPSMGSPQNDGSGADDFGIVCTDVSGNLGYDPGDYNPGFSGTSAASPVAAGVAGLILAVNPELTAEQVRLVMTSTSDKIEADLDRWAGVTGQDLTDFFGYDDVGHSTAFGYGRVNAQRAVAAAAAFGVEGARCDQTGCDFCSIDGRCLSRCTTQADCLDGSVCNPALGACELPVDKPADFLSPCSADCAFCTPTLDTEFNSTSICTVECGSDDDCPDGFDCRLTEEGGPSICGVGDKSAGDPADFFFSCFSAQIGTSLIVVADGDHQLCGDVCFDEGPGACPFGFSCGLADCECSAGNGNSCFQFTCAADDNPDNVDGNDFPFPVCLPNPGFADVCDSDVDCQFGDYCDGGHCRLDDRDGCDICKTCATSEDCDGRGICIGARDDGIGQCVWGCTDSDPCPGDSVCRTIDGGFGPLQVCLSPNGGTDEATRCDPDYSCTVACRDDVPCGDGEVCDEGVCVPAPPDDGGGDEPPGPSGGGCACGATSTNDGVVLAAALMLVAGVRRRRR
jgi:MYXO-CTERM domain-containing protein